MGERALGTWLAQRSGELRLALRTTLAGLITFALAHVLALPQGYWAVLTSVIIIQASVGSSLKASLDRLMATVAGAIWGVAVALAVPHGTLPLLGAALALALAPLAILAAFRPSFRLAPVTAIIMLLSASGSQLGPLSYAIDRVLEIALGCVIGLAVSLFVLPARAHGLMTDVAAKAVRIMGELLDVLLRDPSAAADRPAVATLHGRLRGAIAGVESLAEEARRERAHRLTDAPDPEPVARNLRRLRNDLASLGRSLGEPLPTPAQYYLGAALAGLRDKLTAFLAAAAGAFEGGGPPPDLTPVDSALAAFDEAVAALRRAGALRDLGVEAVGRTFSLAFTLRQMRENLGDLADRIAERRAGAAP
jgi:uncharacterized membrane protein YccC